MFTLFQRNTSNSIPINEIDNMIESINLIDIREVFEYRNGSIKSAKNIPMSQLLANPAKYLDSNKTYHIMCHSGGRSASAVAVLQKAGYDVINLKGGMLGYHGRYKK